MHRAGGTVLGAAILIGAFAGELLACGATLPTPFTGDDAGSGVDATVVDAGLDTGVSIATPDVVDAPVTIIPPAETGPPPLVGKCESVQGPACDLVLQDCPKVDGGTQQCTTRGLADGGYTTECIPTTTSQHLQAGHGCCLTGDPSKNPCAFGLECIGDPNLPCDGGVLPGRCTPHCCGGDAGDDYLCGASVPEGYPGHCNVQVVDSNGVPLFNACTYELGCKPFGLKPCPPNEVCEVVDTTGTSSCSTIYVPDGGPAPGEGEPCVALNNCQDGLVCLQTGANSQCFMMCLTPGTNPPFDAGALDGGPFHGGCPANEACNIPVGGFPPWVSFCGP
jgi:hypothetical protein